MFFPVEMQISVSCESWSCARRKWASLSHTSGRPCSFASRISSGLIAFCSGTWCWSSM